MSTEDREHCVKLGLAFAEELQRKLNGLKAALNCDHDVHAQVAYLYLKGLHEFINQVLPPMVDAALQNLYGEKPVTH